MARGRSHKIKVTIPEGFTAAEIAVLLDSASICSGEKFLGIVEEKLLEGYLFPDTYFFDIDMPPYSVADVLRDSFNKKFSNDLRKSAVESGLSEKDTVILASLIEKEAKKDEERPLISAVFRNRLKKGWHLESCATIIYALGKHKDRLTYKDTKVNSPYNTYLFPGLPPSPICNPGFSSLNAAIFPADTDAMFFVSDGAGSHKFSKYFSEHNVNKKKLNQR